jgi:hypothetical protein
VVLVVVLVAVLVVVLVVVVRRRPRFRGHENSSFVF